MKVDKRQGSGVAKIHIEDDGSYFQISQVGSSLDDLKHVSPHHLVMSAVTAIFHISPVLFHGSNSYFSGSLRKQEWE